VNIKIRYNQQTLEIQLNNKSFLKYLLVFLVVQNLRTFIHKILLITQLTKLP